LVNAGGGAPVNLVLLGHMAAPDAFELVIGPEHDDALFTRLRRAVESAHGSIRELSYDVAGSQEICSFQIVLPAGTLRAIAETYVGLSLCGPEVLVRQLAAAIANSTSTDVA
jgi:hypothetical protein